MTIRGNATPQNASPPSITLTNGAALIRQQSLAVTFDYVTDVGKVTTWATNVLAALGTIHPRPVITVVGKTQALLAFLLSTELSQRINLSDVAADLFYRTHSTYHYPAADRDRRTYFVRCYSGAVCVVCGLYDVPVMECFHV